MAREPFRDGANEPVFCPVGGSGFEVLFKAGVSYAPEDAPLDVCFCSADAAYANSFILATDAAAAFPIRVYERPSGHANNLLMMAFPFKACPIHVGRVEFMRCAGVENGVF